MHCDRTGGQLTLTNHHHHHHDDCLVLLPPTTTTAATTTSTSTSTPTPTPTTTTTTSTTTLSSHKVTRVNWINWVQPGHLGQAGTPCSTGSTGTAHLLAPYADALDLCFDAQACNGMLESCTEIRSLQSISTDFHRSVAEASFKCCQQCTWKSRLGPLPSEAHPIRGGPFITFFFPSEARNHWLG